MPDTPCPLGPATLHVAESPGCPLLPAQGVCPYLVQGHDRTLLKSKVHGVLRDEVVGQAGVRRDVHGHLGQIVREAAGPPELAALPHVLQLDIHGGREWKGVRGLGMEGPQREPQKEGGASGMESSSGDGGPWETLKGTRGLREEKRVPKESGSL